MLIIGRLYDIIGHYVLSCKHIQLSETQPIPNLVESALVGIPSSV
jgi:hypothetical protein